MVTNEAHSPFVGVGFGVDWQRFGRADTTQSTAQALGPFVELRSGWTFLRLTDVDIEVATSLQLPLHRRIDSGDEARRDWAPLLLFELGVAFGL